MNKQNHNTDFQNISFHNIDFLTTAVGRGHRFYLEGLHKALREAQPKLETQLEIHLKTQLFEATKVSGFPASIGWNIINRLYRKGSASGPLGAAYSRLRSESDPNSESAALRLFGAGLRSWWSKRNNPLVVDHPLLVKLLCAKPNPLPLIYIHGELVAPNESLVSGADLIVVPTENAKEKFTAAGIPAAKVAVSGLCIEKVLLEQAEKAKGLRLKRIESNQPLTGAYFSSGAEPIEHCQKIIATIQSCQKHNHNQNHNQNQNHKSIVFATAGGRLQKMLKDSNLNNLPTISLQSYSSIAEEETLLSKLFCEIDYYISPAHERVNWTLGLSLPLFILLPTYGSFAPLNHNLTINFAHAQEIKTSNDAENLGATIEQLRVNGVLKQMNAKRDEEFNKVEGFENSARILLEHIT